MKCPHCLIAFHYSPTYEELGGDKEGRWYIEKSTCPACSKMILYLVLGGELVIVPGLGKRIHPQQRRELVRPRGSMRPPCPTEVSQFSQELADDYTEACIVLSYSAKASAALSRRGLQHVLREVARVKPGNLADEISEAIGAGNLPSHISQSLDAVRVIGNFAAHPQKSQKTGEILPVEPGEAEWNLDVLEALFDFYFVQPEVIKKKKAALNAKLVEAGKQPLP